MYEHQFSGMFERKNNKIHIIERKDGNNVYGVLSLYVFNN